MLDCGCGFMATLWACMIDDDFSSAMKRVVGRGVERKEKGVCFFFLFLNE